MKILDAVESCCLSGTKISQAVCFGAVAEAAAKVKPVEIVEIWLCFGS